MQIQIKQFQYRTVIILTERIEALCDNALLTLTLTKLLIDSRTCS